MESVNSQYLTGTPTTEIAAAMRAGDVQLITYKEFIPATIKGFPEVGSHVTSVTLQFQYIAPVTLHLLYFEQNW